jgi:type IV pilus assembly protein PilB
LDPNVYRDHLFYEAKGCSACKGTGYTGRKAIIELVELDDDMRELLIKRAPASVLKHKAVSSGTTFLRKAALQEVIQGVTSLREANRVTFVETGAT